MDIKALLVVEESWSLNTEKPLALAHLDILGKSALQRTVDSLLAAGVDDIAVVSASSQAEAPEHDSGKLAFTKVEGAQLWNNAKTAYNKLTANEASAVLLARMNHYCEIDWKELFRRHRHHAQRLTRAWSNETAPLDIFVADPEYPRDADFLLQSGLQHARLNGARHMLSPEEYTHPLQQARDLREIAVDALNLRCQMRPVGKEVRPGIWMGERSRVDKGVRLVAPAYIGKKARVRVGAVVTRGSVIEHHSVVDCGTVVEDTTLLPYSVAGAGLDLAHAVIGSRQLFDLKRDVVVAIHDRSLIDESVHHAGLRTIKQVAALAAFLPMQFWRGVTQREPLPVLAAATAGVCSADFNATVVKNKEPRTSLAPEMAGMRRYGNQ